MTIKSVEAKASDRLRLYVVDMLHRAEAMIPDLEPLDCPDAAYTRISDDVEGQGLGVERQTEDSLREAERDGVTIPDRNMFSDNDISASTLSKKPRPGFERMVAYVLTRQITRVYAYSNSRLTRRPMELEVLIQLAEQYGLTIRTAVSGDDNLNTADGRMTARIKAAVDAAEAEKTSERVKRQKQQRLAGGLPPGSRYRTFGYTRDWQPIEGEAAIVRETFDRVARGESVNAVTRDLIARGVKPVSGGEWRFQVTARMLESRIYAGRLSYKGQDAGPSKVPALITESQFQAAQNRERKAAWNARTGLLSGIAVCSRCNTAMNLSEGAYVCARIAGGCGAVRIKREWLDNATDSVIWFLMMWKRTQELTNTGTSTDTADEAEALVTQLDREIEEVQQALGAGDMDLADALPVLKEKRARRAKAAEDAEAALSAANDETWRDWDEYVSSDVSSKRTMIRRHLTAVMVSPATLRGRSTYDPDRFRVVTVYRDAEGKVLEFSGRGCGQLREARDMHMATDPSRFDRIHIEWGQGTRLVKGPQEGILESDRGGARIEHHIEGGTIAFDMPV
ncbi:recombinase family protein [Nocardioides kongjuensis]|uniref:DNA invertase Pin-like site-specific DNA recombinase n=1 Tax=Nocardioides kongjuensis TaxID=349522 RepID=A0A852RKV0_9ACTN|nr:recombinase family protein [Nocardioides kongjuensis]NYD31248.1 DNA invertase Pin-like site-specific DNA recombinase [Nocardioides kongjuensis]